MGVAARRGFEPLLDAEDLVPFALDVGFEGMQQDPGARALEGGCDLVELVQQLGRQPDGDGTGANLVGHDYLRLQCITLYYRVVAASRGWAAPPHWTAGRL